MPLREVSRTLEVCPICVAERGRRERPEGAGRLQGGAAASPRSAWPPPAHARMRAVLFEAANGPERKADVECLETLCACACGWFGWSKATRPGGRRGWRSSVR